MKRLFLLLMICSTVAVGQITFKVESMVTEDSVVATNDFVYIHIFSENEQEYMHLVNGLSTLKGKVFYAGIDNNGDKVFYWHTNASFYRCVLIDIGEVVSVIIEIDGQRYFQYSGKKIE